MTTVGWGTIALKGVKGGTPGSFIMCHDVAAGTAANPGGGAPATDTVPGSGLIQVFATFDCESEGICPLGSTPGLLAEELAWTNQLEIVAGIVRQKTTGIKLFVTCSTGKKVEGGVKFVSSEATICCKGLTPASKRGTSALYPGFLEFGAGSGELDLEGDEKHETTLVAPEGELKLLGYDEQQLIRTKKDPAPSPISHLEYVVQDGVTSVYDMDHEYKLLKTISLPSTEDQIRGVTVAPSTHLMFIPHGGDGPVNGSGNGSVLAYDLVTEKPVWDVKLSTGIDSGQVSPDATKLYIPTGENT
ncbi:MAG TPA: hypothetical protein VGX26_02520, partial [Solirubrobacteraceae bacterium]|nr:hypothetical protein [Solirubrobacteraceae bacterium]